MDLEAAIHAILPRCSFDAAASMAAVMPHCQIDTPDRISAFLAQVAVESLEMTVWEENLYYSAEALMGTWPDLFSPLQVAAKFAYRPRAIANRAYADRMGNGSEFSGDGYRYRGRGPLQITGKDTYAACGTALGIDLLIYPGLLAVLAPGCGSACHYWVVHDCNNLADARDFQKITEIITGARTAQAHRLAYYNDALRYFGIPVKPRAVKNS